MATAAAAPRPRDLQRDVGICKPLCIAITIIIIMIINISLSLYLSIYLSLSLSISFSLSLYIYIYIYIWQLKFLGHSSPPDGRVGVGVAWSLLWLPSPPRHIRSMKPAQYQENEMPSICILSLVLFTEITCSGHASKLFGSMFVY